MRRLGLAAAALALPVACSGGGSAPPDAGDAAPEDAGEAPPDGSVPPHPKSLPFSYTRPESGAPVDAATISAKTDELIDLLVRTRYFGFVDERVHGWPESDPQKRFWYGTWWTGVDVHVAGGKVTYFHNSAGAENNGIGTSPLLEGACFAHRLWPSARIEHLLRKLVRGFSSWMMAMKRSREDPDGLLARAADPPPIQSSDGAVSFFIDTAAARPGMDSGSSEFVHVAVNPTWGDVWVQNKRSKDDIGHMMRAIAELDTCDGTFAEAGAEGDLVEMRRLYQTFGRRVEDDGWAIATLGKNLDVTIPSGTLAHYLTVGTIDAECDQKLALRLFARRSPGALDCGNGVSAVDQAASDVGHSNGLILRSSHEAAAGHALLANELAAAHALLEGLAQRLDAMLDALLAGQPPPFVTAADAADLIVHAANVGVPLTWREVAFLHGQLDVAHQTLLAPANDPVYATFQPSTADGSYAYQPAGDGLDFRMLGALLGACAAEWRNPASKPALDCAKLAAWSPVF